MRLNERLDKVRDALGMHLDEEPSVNMGWPDEMDRPSVRQVGRGLLVPQHIIDRVAAADGDLSEALRIARQQGIKLPDPDTGPWLYDRLAPIAKIIDRHALSVNYRTVALTAEEVRAAAPFGAMRCPLNLDITDEVCVDATAFLGVLRNAPEAKFTARVRHQALHWQCGHARGSLPLINAMVAAPRFTEQIATLSPQFAKGLVLGALGCGHSAFLRNAGLEAIQLVNRDGTAYALSSDSTMLSCCALGPALPTERIVTLKPEAAVVLAQTVRRAADHPDPDMWLGINDTSVYCLTPQCELQLYQLAVPHDYNLLDRIQPYLRHQTTMPVLYDAVAAFLRRVDSHAEFKQQAMVTIAVQDGVTVLNFTEALGETEQHYRVANGPKITAQPIRLEARRLAKGLQYANELVFDYAAENTLVLRGPNEFVLAITGRR